MFRSSNGATRIDQGSQTLITNPAAGQSINLDHLKKEAIVCPMPAIPALPGIPGVKIPGFSLPQPPLSVKELGVRMIAGLEVQGKMFTFSPPKIELPQIPGMPKLPGLPGVPGAPGIPGLSANIPKPQTLEVWTSLKLLLPMASRMLGIMGKQTTLIKAVLPGEPPAAMFQIPAGYKLIQCPHAPKPPL